MRRSHLTGGYSFVELVFVLGLFAVLGGMAVPLVTDTIDHVHTAGAARHVAARIAATRLEAVRRSSTVALRFEPAGANHAITPFLDGNGNGIRAIDIAGGVDRSIGSTEYLCDRFAGTAFGLLGGVPDLDGATGSSNGVRIGSSQFLSVSPNGSSTGGTLYIHGRRRQYAVRVLGATGRVRFFSYDTGAGRWITR